MNIHFPLRETECESPHLQYALYSVDPSQQVQPPTEDAQHTGYDSRQSHRLQHLRGSCKRTRTQVSAKSASRSTTKQLDLTKFHLYIYIHTYKRYYVQDKGNKSLNGKDKPRMCCSQISLSKHSCRVKELMCHYYQISILHPSG